MLVFILIIYHCNVDKSALKINSANQGCSGKEKKQPPFINTKLLERILANLKNISYVALINVSHIKVTVASEMKHEKTVSSNPV